MSLNFNNTNITEAYYNGVKLSKIEYNGTVVFSAGGPPWTTNSFFGIGVDDNFVYLIQYSTYLLHKLNRATNEITNLNIKLAYTPASYYYDRKYDYHCDRATKKFYFSIINTSDDQRKAYVVVQNGEVLETIYSPDFSKYIGGDTDPLYIYATACGSDNVYDFNNPSEGFGGFKGHLEYLEYPAVYLFYVYNNVFYYLVNFGRNKYSRPEYEYRSRSLSSVYTYNSETDKITYYSCYCSILNYSACDLHPERNKHYTFRSAPYANDKGLIGIVGHIYYSEDEIGKTVGRRLRSNENKLFEIWNKDQGSYKDIGDGYIGLFVQNNFNSDSIHLDRPDYNQKAKINMDGSVEWLRNSSSLYEHISACRVIVSPDNSPIYYNDSTSIYNTRFGNEIRKAP